MARGPPFGGGPGAVVVPTQDLEYSRDVFPVLHRKAYVALRASPVRPCPALREQVLARLWGHGDVRDSVAVDVPDLTLAVAKRYGIEPSGLRGHPRPEEHLPLDLREQFVIHPIPPVIRASSGNRSCPYVRGVATLARCTEEWFSTCTSAQGPRQLPVDRAPVAEEAASGATVW